MLPTALRRGDGHAHEPRSRRPMARACRASGPGGPPRTPWATPASRWAPQAPASRSNPRIEPCDHLTQPSPDRTRPMLPNLPPTGRPVRHRKRRPSRPRWAQLRAPGIGTSTSIRQGASTEVLLPWCRCFPAASRRTLTARSSPRVAASTSTRSKRSIEIPSMQVGPTMEPKGPGNGPSRPDGS